MNAKALSQAYWLHNEDVRLKYAQNIVPESDPDACLETELTGRSSHGVLKFKRNVFYSREVIWYVNTIHVHVCPIFCKLCVKVHRIGVSESYYDACFGS